MRNKKSKLKLSVLAMASLLVFQSQATDWQDKPIQLSLQSTGKTQHIKSKSTSARNSVFGSPALVLDDGTLENNVGFSGPEFIWLNRFTPAAIDFPFQIEDISIMFGDSATSFVNVGSTIDIFLYSDTDGDNDPGTGAVLLSSFSDVVQAADAQTFSNYNLSVPVEFAGPTGDVLIAVVLRGGLASGNFPAGQDTATSQDRSWLGTYTDGVGGTAPVPASPTLPADDVWGTIDSFKFPGNWMIRASGVSTPVELMNFSVE